MNLKNKTDKELWDMLNQPNKTKKMDNRDSNIEFMEIYREIKRREKNEQAITTRGEGDPTK